MTKKKHYPVDKELILLSETYGILILIVNQLSMKGTTEKPVLSGHSKIDKIKDLKTDDSLMKVESIAECSL